MADSTPPSQVQIPASNTQPSVPPSHYHVIYFRRGKWVAQVYRSGEDFKMIYIGTYSTQEMAAIAYDVAALTIRGDNGVFNFPDKIRSHPMPKSNSIADIREAVTAAVAQFGARPNTVVTSEVPPQEIGEYVNEEELFNKPQILIEMAEGLMVSPPKFGPSNIPPSRYRGVILRGDKWASKVNRQYDSKSIWLGTYSTPEMAAIAHDVAELAINGVRAWLNFPDAIRSLPVPKSNSIVDIREAAAVAAEQFSARLEVVDAFEVPSQEIVEYVDEEELFNMPQILIEMAEGLMVSPPRFGPPDVPPSHYRGIYSRCGNWAAQVYKSEDPKKIYLGTYSTPEMAAIAYDVAVLAIRGENAVFNFPNIIRSHPVPKSNSVADIRAAAVAAAVQFGARPKTMDTSEVPSQEIGEYVDEEELFNMPQILIEMAEGLMNKIYNNIFILLCVYHFHI
ncbi:hypothetical protein IEQ34_015049 [Dendrobium chrysotoxum]|uniref:AP2/ERF domain-containing protein n=1 Tax=Dendrobium chrysotoxum TaxID=161865 RepID=A0AAV7GNP1_DENCH|nr:hypothetical protein IEQ34_015049 [Dendrobium chrysotoxum]